MSSLKTLLKICVAALLIGWLVRSGALDLRVLGDLLFSPVIIPLLLCAVGNIMLNHYRWLLLLRSQNLNYSFLSSVPLTFIGLFFGFAIPGGVGGDVVKTYYLVREQPGRRLSAAVTVLWDRLIGLFGMLLVAFVTLMLHSELLWQQTEIRAIAVALGALLIGFILGFTILLQPHLYALVQRWTRSWPRVHSLLTRLEQSMVAFRQNKLVFVRCILVSWVSLMLAISFILLVAFHTSDNVDWRSYFFIIPLVFVATALPITPAGIGVGQAAIYFLFKVCTGEVSQVGPNAITAWQVANLLWGVVGAYFYLRYKQSDAAVHA